MRGGSNRPLSPSPIPASPSPPLKQWRSSSNQSDRSFCLGLEIVRVDLDFEWSCCLDLETERVVLVGNERENLGSSMKE